MKEAIWKHCMIPIKSSVIFRGNEEGKIGRTKYFLDSWTILCDTMVDTHQYTSDKTHRMCNITECKKPTGQSKVNYGL